MPDGYVDAALGLGLCRSGYSSKGQQELSSHGHPGIGLCLHGCRWDGPLQQENSKASGRGEVDVTEASCEVKGLDTIAQEAIGLVTDGMAKQLGTSSKILDAAEARKASETSSFHDRCFEFPLL